MRALGASGGFDSSHLARELEQEHEHGAAVESPAQKPAEIRPGESTWIELAAALLRDLRQRGLLERTVVAFVSEFGRMPTFQKGASGRDHNPQGFTVWLTGAGVKRGFSFGQTDDFGHKAIDPVTTIYDLHATLLHLLGLDDSKLRYFHAGREKQLSQTGGHVIREFLA